MASHSFDVGVDRGLLRGTKPAVVRAGPADEATAGRFAAAALEPRSVAAAGLATSGLAAACAAGCCATAAALRRFVRGDVIGLAFGDDRNALGSGVGADIAGRLGRTRSSPDCLAAKVPDDARLLGSRHGESPGRRRDVVSCLVAEAAAGVFCPEFVGRSEAFAAAARRDSSADRVTGLAGLVATGFHGSSRRSASGWLYFGAACQPSCEGDAASSGLLRAKNPPCATINSTAAQGVAIPEANKRGRNMDRSFKASCTAGPTPWPARCAGNGAAAAKAPRSNSWNRVSTARRPALLEKFAQSLNSNGGVGSTRRGTAMRLAPLTAGPNGRYPDCTR
jgi:hypothetical protein